MMRKLLTSRAFYCVVCLILVCVLVVNVSPIRARAVGVDQFVGVAIDKVGFYAQAGAVSTGAAVFSWVLLGLGLIVTTVQAVELMNDYMEWSGELETSIYYYPDGSWSYGVDIGFVERVRAFLWDQGLLVQNTELQLDSANYPPADALAEAKSAKYSVLVYSRYNGGPLQYYLAYSNESQVVVETPYANNTGICIRTKDSGAAIYLYQPSTGSFYKCNSSTAADGNKYYVVESVQYFGQLIIPDVEITIDGAEIAVVAPPEVNISTGYPEWHTNARPVTNPDTEEEITVLPIPLNPSVDLETQIGTLTQSDVWQGSIADPLPDTDTNPDTGNDSWSPSGDMQHFTLDLKEYFPFCIPFDLYDFFTCLNADPVAPVIEWLIPLPGGDTYPLELDLSSFDPVAQLLRRLQLLLFCVGLAFKTRDLIKG